MMTRRAMMQVIESWVRALATGFDSLTGHAAASASHLQAINSAIRDATSGERLLDVHVAGLDGDYGVTDRLREIAEAAASPWETIPPGQTLWGVVYESRIAPTTTRSHSHRHPSYARHALEALEEEGRIEVCCFEFPSRVRPNDSFSNGWDWGGKHGWEVVDDRGKRRTVFALVTTEERANERASEARSEAAAAINETIPMAEAWIAEREAERAASSDQEEPPTQ